jgi:hypothetical protein
MYQDLVARKMPEQIDEDKYIMIYLNDYIHDLRKAVEHLDEQYEQSLTREQRLRDLHRLDIKTISETFINEANERGYCDAYDEVITALNKKLHYELDNREQDYEITAKYMVTVTYTTTAKCLADAEETANEMELHDYASRVSDFYDIEEHDTSVRLAN